MVLLHVVSRTSCPTAKRIGTDASVLKGGGEQLPLIADYVVASSVC